MRVNEDTLLINGNMATSLTSDAQPLAQTAISGIQAVWTGAPVGTLKLQISNDGITYSDYTGSSTAVSGPGDFLWNIASCGFNWIQVAYVRTSGTGTLNITASIKGV